MAETAPARRDRSLKEIWGSLKDAVVTSRVWRSLIHYGWPDNALDRSLAVTSSFFLHIHSVKVSRRSLRWTYTFGLGVMACVLFGVLIFTGVLLMFYYVPSVERAYSTMKDLQFAVSLGQFTRNMHRWSAHAMVIIVALHMVRVFFTGAHRAPRELNWLIGVALLLLTLGSSFTGYLLPWDQLAFWAITVGTNIAGYAPGVGPVLQTMLLGGPSVGQSTLIRFYTLHVALLPITMVILVSLHLWRIRKDGGLAASDNKAPVEPTDGNS